MGRIIIVLGTMFDFFFLVLKYVMIYKHLKTATCEI